MQLQLTWQLLLTLPFLIIGGFYGWRRGWREEGITLIGLLGALLFFGSASRAGLLGTLVNRIAQAFGLFFSTLLGRDITSSQVVNDGNRGVFQFVGFVVFVALAYIIGGALGQRGGLNAGGRALGAFLGLVNVFVIASQAFGFIRDRLPSVFQREGSILISPDTDAVAIRNALPTIFALLLIVLLIVVFLRLPKIRQ